MCPERLPSLPLARRLRGMALVSAIFLLAALGLLAAGIAALVSFEHSESALDIQGARALRAAQAGIDWGAYRVLPPSNDTCATGWPATLTAGTLPGTLSPFQVTVSCSHTTHGSIGMYKLTATAVAGSDASGDRVVRQLTVWLSPSP